MHLVVVLVAGGSAISDIQPLKWAKSQHDPALALRACYVPGSWLSNLKNSSTKHGTAGDYSHWLHSESLYIFASPVHAISYVQELVLASLGAMTTNISLSLHTLNAFRKTSTLEQQTKSTPAVLSEGLPGTAVVKPYTRHLLNTK